MTTTHLPYLDYNDIHLEERIGKGNFSVYRATAAGKVVAVKKIDCKKKNEIPPEVEVQSSLPPHPNVLSLLGIAHSKDGFFTYICMELADTNLYQYLHMKKKSPSLQQSTKWATQIARGMHHLHQHGLVHYDLKSANVLLFERADITKVSDFGSARHVGTQSRITGTYRWMAPELNDKSHSHSEINQSSDVFSYGMVLYEIFVHEVPFADIEEGVDVASNIRDGGRPSIPSELPPFIKELMQFCWKHEAHDRPTFNTILKVGSITAIGVKYDLIREMYYMFLTSIADMYMYVEGKHLNVVVIAKLLCREQ